MKKRKKSWPLRFGEEGERKKKKGKKVTFESEEGKKLGEALGGIKSKRLMQREKEELTEREGEGKIGGGFPFSQSERYVREFDQGESGICRCFLFVAVGIWLRNVTCSPSLDLLHVFWEAHV